MRCKKCNKNVSTLYNGLCTGCMSVNIKETNDQVNTIMNSSVPDGLLLNPERLDEAGGFAKLIRESSSKKVIKTVDTDRAAALKKSNKPKKSSDSEEFNILLYIRGEFTEKDKRAYKPSLRNLGKKYIVMLKRGMYFICKASEFGKSEETGGEVIESHGGIVVFKGPSYYDPDKVSPDSYIDDNTSIDLDDEDDSEIVLGSEVE